MNGEKPDKQCVLYSSVSYATVSDSVKMEAHSQQQAQENKVRLLDGTQVKTAFHSGTCNCSTMLLKHPCRSTAATMAMVAATVLLVSSIYKCSSAARGSKSVRHL